MSQQAADFRHGQRKKYRKSRRRSTLLRNLKSCGLISARGVCRRSTDPRQEGMSQHNQGDMAIPADPATNLIVIQPQVFSVFSRLLRAVNEGMSTRGDVAEKDAHLAVLNLSRRATILFANASRFSARGCRKLVSSMASMASYVPSCSTA